MAVALQRSRQDTLATFAIYEAALHAQGRADLSVPYAPELNPPLWELGHISWFQDWWLARYPHHPQGTAADPDLPRLPARRPNADALYNSSQVAHGTRWQLPLPGAPDTCADAQAALQDTLRLLAQAEETDSALYFHRLVLAHEDMHHEAAVYMAQALGIALHDPRWQQQPLPGPAQQLRADAALHVLGHANTRGFVFDNECGTRAVPLAAYAIDTQVLRWRDYLPFVHAGGYAQPQWWPGAAGVWRAAQTCAAPRYLRQHVQAGGPDENSPWQHWRHGHWQPLDLDLPACHLTAFEAQAWCAWAGRRLPSEAEWEHAALLQPAQFAWGAVWEWTASAFQPYEGFVAHPYRDYSAPWFGSRRVLRGASVATQPRMHNLRYRNFFTPERNDIFAGFRTCAL